MLWKTFFFVNESEAIFLTIMKHKYHKKIPINQIRLFSEYIGSISMSKFHWKNFGTPNLAKNHHFYIFHWPYLDFNFIDMAKTHQIFYSDYKVAKKWYYMI